MSKPQYRRDWQRIRRYILGNNTICHLCGKPGADTVDHIIPISKGGSWYDPANLAPAHGSCNYSKGNRPTWKPLKTSEDW